MTTPDARVRDRPPPPWFIHRVANPLMRWLLPRRAGRMLPGMALLRFSGRRTGTAYAVPAAIYDYRGDQVVFTDGRWGLNFVGGSPLQLTRRGQTGAAHGHLVDDPAYVGPAIRAALNAGTSTLMLGLAIDRGHRPTDAELAAVRRAVVIRTEAAP
jgi:hypothetical protein